MIIEFDGNIIEYEIDRARRKNIYICIRDGKVIIKGPRRMSAEEARDIVIKKKNWISKKILEENKSTRKNKESKFFENEKFYKRKAEQRIIPIMEKMIRITGLTPLEVKLVNFKRAWGNCSNKKVIKLSNKLVMYSDTAIEYVCLHELCHLKYMNHSKAFWNLVSKYMPNYKDVEKELK